MNNRIKLPELLCPAGSPEAFRAAIEGGADAIYVGGTAFNARINAKNFTPDELREAISLAHAYGVKVYVAANTLIYDTEADPFLRAAEEAYLCGADALIVADIGSASDIKRRIPIELHGSTQMSGHNIAAARYLAELGFSRMVCAREMSREDLTALAKNSPIEIEAFVHGALCVCHSGQCLFSSIVGGRSGNRGECAQPCRLPFSRGKSKNEYPLSLKDLSLARHVPELCEMGISSFKIEGRMKSPEYVRDVAKIWRRLIDENRGADDNEMAELSGIFSRGGFTDGYYQKQISNRMLGVRSEEDKKSSRELAPFDKITKKLPLDLSARLSVGEPMTLTVSTGERSATVTGGIPEAAIKTPLSREAVEKNLVKLGSTPYFARSVEINIEGELMVSLSSINALRRSAIDALTNSGEGESARGEKDILWEKMPLPAAVKSASGVSAYFHFPDRIPDGAKDFFDIIYLPIEKYDGSVNGAALPPVIFDSERDKMAELIKKARNLGCQHILVGNIGHFELVRDSQMQLHGDLRLNITNSQSAAHFEGELEDIILSPELTLPRLRDIRRARPYSRVLVYGRIPLMVTEKCVGKEVSDCNSCSRGSVQLTDRRGIKFPVLRAFEHRSLIVNSLPTYMADREDLLSRYGLSARHFIFTVESKEEASSIINAYRRHLPPKTDVRRIKLTFSFEKAWSPTAAGGGVREGDKGKNKEYFKR